MCNGFLSNIDQTVLVKLIDFGQVLNMYAILATELIKLRTYFFSSRFDHAKKGFSINSMHFVLAYKRRIRNTIL